MPSKPAAAAKPKQMMPSSGDARESKNDAVKPVEKAIVDLSALAGMESDRSFLPRRLTLLNSSATSTSQKPNASLSRNAYKGRLDDLAKSAKPAKSLVEPIHRYEAI